MSFLALAGALGVLSPFAMSTSPDLMWRDVESVSVHCNVQAAPSEFRHRLIASLCERVRDAAAQGAPVPVRIVELGDPEMIRPGNVTLLVHASAEADDQGGYLLAYTIRPYRLSAESTEYYYGSPPRAISLPGPGLENSAIDRSLEAALSDVLPWLSRQRRRPQPIPQQP